MSDSHKTITLTELYQQQQSTINLIKDLNVSLLHVIEQQNQILHTNNNTSHHSHHHKQIINSPSSTPTYSNNVNNIPKLKLDNTCNIHKNPGSHLPISSPRSDKVIIEKWIEETTNRNKQNDNDNIIKLDVGGKFYSTTHSTLNKYSNSMLATMFSGQYQLNKDKDGRIFIDRDGKLFAHILSFLRDGPLWTPPIDLELKRKIDLEFSYFGLPTFGYGFNYHHQPHQQLLSSITSPNITPRCVCGIKNQTLGQDSNHQGIWEEIPGMATSIKSFRLLVNLNNILYAITERILDNNNSSNGVISSSSSNNSNSGNNLHIQNNPNNNSPTSSPNSTSSTSSNSGSTSLSLSSYGQSIYQFEEYNPRSNSWGIVCPILDSMICYYLTSVVVGNDVYAIPDAGLHQPIFKYDSKENKWKNTDAHLPTGRTSFSLQAVDDYIYVIGGYKGSTTTDTVDRYHPKSNSWCNVSPMLSKRAEIASVVLDGNIYVIGGSLSNSNVERYNPHSNLWSIVSTIGGGTSSGINAQRITISSATTLNGKIYAVGSEESDSLNIVLQFNTNTNTWKRVAPLLFSTYNSFSCVVVDGYVYFVPWTGSVVNRYEPCSS